MASVIPENANRDLLQIDGRRTYPETAELIVRDLMQICGHIQLMVKGDCMAPAMPHGCRVTVCSTREKKPRIGDVVLLCYEGGFKLHRLYWRPLFASSTSYWKTRGDRSRSWDPQIRAENILGTVVFVEGVAQRWVRLGFFRLIHHVLIHQLVSVRAYVKRALVRVMRNIYRMKDDERRNPTSNAPGLLREI